jgi:DNA/RNA-binding domain of Phe-tRNA-synthetase-like protein
MTDSEPEPEAVSGAVEPQLAAEFPGLELRWMALHSRGGPSPPSLLDRLRALSDRGRGARVVAMRTQPIAHAYRAFYRQTGLDPDVTRIPSEEAAVRRLLDGGFRSHGRIRDALLIALIETGVPVWALKREAVDPESLAIRVTRAGEGVSDRAPGAGERPQGVGETPPGLGEGRLVIADADRVHGPLFGPLAPGHGAAARTQNLVLVCVGVDGVPSIFLEEALWLCAEILADD